MTVTTPPASGAAGVAAGLKSSGGHDVALVVNDGPSHDAAAVFTANRCKANPVLWSEQVVKDGVVRAVVPQLRRRQLLHRPGRLPDHPRRRRAGRERLGIGAVDVLVCSTGLIGLANHRDALLAGVDAAYDALRPTAATTPRTRS